MYRRRMAADNLQSNTDNLDEEYAQDSSVGKVLGKLLMYLFIGLAAFQFLYAFLGSFGLF